MTNLNLLLEISINWSIWLAVYYVLFRKRTFFNINRIFLIGTLLLGLLIPLVQPFFVVTQQIGIFIPIPEIVVTPDHIVHEKVLASEFGITHWLLVVYYAGVTIFSILFLLNFAKLFFATRHLRKERNGRFWLVQLPDGAAPFSFFNIIFICRKEYYQPSEWNQILVHEQTHAKQWHSLDIVLAEMIKIVFWWNPIVYLYKNMIRDVHEFQADQAATKNHSKKEYSRLLFRQSQSGMQVVITSNFIHSQLKKRIKMMMSKQSKPNEIFKYLLALPLVVMLFFISCQQPEVIDGTEIESSSLSTEDVSQVKELTNKLADMKKNGASEAEMNEVVEAISAELEKLPPAPPAPPRPPKKKSHETYKAVDQMPQFQGCDGPAGNGRLDECSEKKMLDYIYANISYPTVARETGISGRVFAQFVVNRSGKMEDIKVLKGIGSGCDEEVMRILDLMKNEVTWRPGKDDAETVNVEYILPVTFKLE